MEKTRGQFINEVEYLINEHWGEIKKAYKDHEFDLKITISVSMSAEHGKIVLAPAIEFFPQPKFKSPKYTVEIDEKQLELFK